MIRWLRAVLPPLGWLVSLALAYGGTTAFVLFLEWRLGQRLPEDVRWQTQRAVLIFGVVGYAVWRAIAYHPLFRPSYRTWLAGTPWKIPKPLPLGPIHLVPQDVLLV